jgi:hypothetical protein
MISTKYFTAPSLNRIGKGAAYFGLTALFAMTAATAQIASGTTGIDASGNTQSEIAACNTGRTQQDRETCLTEARNASAEKRAGKMDGGSAEPKANAMKRCDALTGEEQVACRARIAGYGETQGSVAGGGVIRQVETVVVPADATSVRIQPQTSSDIVVIPAPQ